MRDGVELAMTVRLPAGKTLADGPFPTFIEYSGLPGRARRTTCSSCRLARRHGSDPLAPATSTAVGSLIGPLLGFAVVSVQMRGSGCSGGAFDLFDLPTTYDGYDAVETVAAQSWVKGGKVGMGGISFSGITQLFTAGTRPPHLAADRADVGDRRHLQRHRLPGRHLQLGLRASPGSRSAWTTPSRRRPAASRGRRTLVKAGDKHCLANQKLRLQTQDALQLQKQNPFRTPSLFAHRAPGAWLKRDACRSSWSGQFQDEQTSGHFAESLKYLNGRPDVCISVQNGVHVDSLGPEHDHPLGRVPEALRGQRDPGRAGLGALAQRRALPVPGRRAGGAGAAVALREHDRTSPRPRRSSRRTRTCGS